MFFQSTVKYTLAILCALPITLSLQAQDAIPQIFEPYPANIPVNYIRTWDALAPVTDSNQLVTKPRKEVMQTTSYVDGLGRPWQTVIKQGSLISGASPTDLVNMKVYDEYGREVYNYLPYASTETKGVLKFIPFEQQQQFYNTNNPNSPIKGQGENFFYGKTEYEPSPLNRVDRSYAPGNSWVNQGKGIQVKYLNNTTVDEVRTWNVTDVNNNFGTYNSPGTYPAASLFKTITIDEHNNQVIEFKTKEGLVILKKVQVNANTSDNGTGSGHLDWLCTYYLYDDYSQLRAVIQPLGVDLLRQNGWITTPSILKEQFFRYEYDQRNRMILKKVPGMGLVSMIYDVRDRLVFTQDANMYPNHQWLTTMYDKLNRPVITGITTWTGTATALQDNVNWITVNGPTGGVEFDKVLSASNTSGTYQAIRSFTLDAGFSTAPGSDFATEFVQPGNAGLETSVEGMTVWANPLPSGATFTLLTKTGYDDYNTLPAQSGLTATIDNGYTSSTFLNTGYGSFPYPEQVAQSSRTNGKITWTQTKVLNTASQYLYSVMIYDDKGRVVQTKSKNYTDAVDIATNQYNFAGQMLGSHVKHQKGGTNPQVYEVATRNNYDEAGRLAFVEKNLNNSSWKKITEFTYDAIGQLKTKKLSPDFNGVGLETMEYDYNIRGWMLGANRKYAKETNNTDHYFGFDLGYDKQTVGTSNGTLGSYGQAQYNGNIAGTVWKSKGDGQIRKYDFTYDPVNRLTQADFNQYNSGFNKTAGIDFTVSDLTYDLNGNILTQKQMGLKGTSSTIIDQLAYKYYDQSNRLKNVVDANNDQQTTLGDFRSSQKYMTELGGGKTNQAIDYDQDDNGNLKYDQNKDIESITYNHLNLPQIITIEGNKGSIEYVYDAVGNKLKKVVHETGKSDKTTLYMFGTYEDEVLQFLPMEEGRIRPVQDPVTPFAYDYFVKDHLGNIRMVLTEQQKVDIYPAATLEGDLVANTGAVSRETTFYNIEGANIVSKSNATGIPDYINKNGGSAELDPPVNNNPDGNPTALSEKLYMLDASDGIGKTGLGITLKVMSGDRIDILGKSYYFQNTTGGNYQVPVLDILSGLLGAPTGATAGKAVTATGLYGVTDIYNGVNNFLSNPDRNNGTTIPKAYVNWMLLDDNFKYVAGNFDRVGGADTLKNHLLSNIQITRNGYLYVYVSNESPVKVFFDNLQVIHTKGPLLEETHYYPFGLTMAGISTKALSFGAPENKKKFQGQEFASREFSDGSGLEMYEFKWRMDDPQTGRFWQVDPLADKYVYNSPYAFSENKVIVHRELEGLEAEYIFGKAWQELADNVRGLGNSIDKAITYITNWGSSTPNTEKQIGNTTITNSTNITVSTETSTNFGGRLGYIIRNNTNKGNNEPMTKTTTTVEVSNETKIEVKTSKQTITSKTTVDGLTGNVSSENGVSVKYKGMDVGGSVTVSSTGNMAVKAEASVGNKVKGNSNVTLTTGPDGTNVQMSLGSEQKKGRTTVNQSFGIKINL